jgi:Ca2+-binding RTX toxin-like protein
MIGGRGNDIYFVDDAGDTVIELAGEGTDTIRSTISYTLGSAVEHLELLGATGISGTGNVLDNRIVGNAGGNALYGLGGNDTLIGMGGNDILDGGEGADSMSGGEGSDTYYVDHVDDEVVETGPGIDTVRTTLAGYALGANVENLVYMGAGAFTGTGNELGNSITGGAGNDVLDGGAGADTMSGGLGNDIYHVDDVLDKIIDSGGADDQVWTGLGAYVLANGLETLVFTGTGSFLGTGNGAANSISGSDGDDILDGAGGADILIGGKGNDIYVVDNIADKVFEKAGEGTDTIRSKISLTLGVEIENLELTGTANINATGNAADNKITGNSGNNILNGGLGADTMAGGAGNDTYVVDNAGDFIIEVVGGVDMGGIDLVRTSLSAYTLGEGIENLLYAGSAVSFSGTGNELGNTITGGGGADVLLGLGGHDVLSGGAGNDRLDGGAGVDRLTGGSGFDRFVFRKGEANGDVITDFSGNGSSVGDDILLIGWGAGSTFARIGSTNQFAITDGVDGSVEILTITGTVSTSHDLLFAQAVAVSSAAWASDQWQILL